ncbi:MAG: OsmC family protein [Planctomycetaceae bacterium]
MNADELRTLQKPLKDRYRDDPAAARETLSAVGEIIPGNVTCRVESNNATVEAGLHPATGGTGEYACSGDMLLEALVSCAGVTLAAVATAMNVPLRGGTIRAEGDLDFRGTLGVDREAPVGITDIRLEFSLDGDADEKQLEKLVELTERYCVVFQTLKTPPRISVSLNPQS